MAHKRLTTPQLPPPRSKVRNSVLMAEIDRINHRVRPHPAYVPTEDWLNSACSVVSRVAQGGEKRRGETVVGVDAVTLQRMGLPSKSQRVDRDIFPSMSRLYCLVVNVEIGARICVKKTSSQLSTSDRCETNAK